MVGSTLSHEPNQEPPPSKSFVDQLREVGERFISLFTGDIPSTQRHSPENQDDPLTRRPPEECEDCPPYRIGKLTMSKFTPVEGVKGMSVAELNRNHAEPIITDEEAEEFLSKIPDKTSRSYLNGVITSLQEKDKGHIR